MRRRSGWFALGALAVLLAVVAVAFAVTGGDSDNTSGPDARAPEGSVVGEVTTVDGGVAVPQNVGGQVDLGGLQEVTRMGKWVALTGASPNGASRCYLVQSSVNVGYTSHGCATEEEIAGSPVFGAYWPEGGEGFIVVLVPLDATRVTIDGEVEEPNDGLVLRPYGGEGLQVVAATPKGPSVLTVSPRP